MATFKELSQKAILAMSKEEQLAYWENYRKYIQEQKKEVEKKLRERERAEKSKNRTKLNHARFIVSGAFLKSAVVDSFLQELAKKNSFSDNDKRDLNLLMNDLKKSIKF